MSAHSLAGPARPLRDAWTLAVESGLTSSMGLAALCGVYGLAYEVRPTAWALLSATCLFWILFLADRLAEEAPDEAHSAAFVRSRRGLMLGLLGVAVLGQIVCCIVHPPWALAILGALVCGLAYFTPLPLLGRAVKDLPGAKSFYAATLILAIAHLYVWPLQPASWGQVGAMGAVLLLEQISNAVYDLKDVESDRRQGIQTLILMLGLPRFLAVEAAAAVLGLVLVLGWWTPASPGFAASLVLHLVALGALRRRPFDRTMTVGLDLVYSSMLGVAVLVGAGGLL